MPYKYFQTFLVGLTLWVSAFSQASIITTTFDSNNYYSGNMFDLTTFNKSLLITEADLHLRSVGYSALVSLYTRVGGYRGFESSSQAWTLQGQQQVTSAGNGKATSFNFDDFIVNDNTLYGFYFAVSEYRTRPVYMNYTNGAQSYSNDDLSLELGIGKGYGDFSSAIFNPRSWNGSLSYNEVQSINTSSYTEVPSPTTFSTFALAIIGLAVRRLQKR